MPQNTPANGSGSLPAPAGAGSEVVARPARRRFTAEYKLRIVQEAERCTTGDLGALLRREGLYSSHLTTWRKQRAVGRWPSSSRHTSSTAAKWVTRLRSQPSIPLLPLGPTAVPPLKSLAQCLLTAPPPAFARCQQCVNARFGFGHQPSFHLGVVCGHRALQATG